MIEIQKAMTEQECKEATLPPKGIFRFKVVNTKEKTSDKVGDFLSLMLELDLKNGKKRNIFDNLFFAEEWLWKTRHFYRSANRMDIYESMKFMAQDCDFLEGFAEIDHRVKKDTGEVESYVKDYITMEVPPELDDDVPNF